MVMPAPHIALIVTGAESLADLIVFVKTIEVWHPDGTLYVLTDSATNIESISFT